MLFWSLSLTEIFLGFWKEVEGRQMIIMIWKGKKFQEKYPYNNFTNSRLISREEWNSFQLIRYTFQQISHIQMYTLYLGCVDYESKNLMA